MDQLLPYFLILAVVTALFSLPCWSFIDDPKSSRGQRVGSLDGMRGYLALSVMFHHAFVARNWLETGVWTLPPNPFYAQLGSMAVSLFFMITGYLFWGKLAAKGGRVNWISLYVGRLFRIGPVYLLALSGLLLVVMVRSQWQLHEPANLVARELMPWLTLGLLTGSDINGVAHTGLILAGVVWSLSFEWLFYIALLPLSLVARRRWHLVSAAVLLCVSIFESVRSTHAIWHFVLLFSVGMVTSSLHAMGWKVKADGILSSVAALAALVATLAIHAGPYTIGQSLPLALFFFLVCNGASLFGLFGTLPAIRLGHVSYSIYLLQGFVFSIGFNNASMRGILTSGHTLFFWFATAAGAIILCTVASAVYALLERPCIELGRRVGGNLSMRGGKLMAVFGS
ncbi:acyltransferase family protein [Trinickia dinghuensis]|uniref:Acyltransferase n=1 Tax=Trinickia dinghuensis TaxID=2291023 RepID=A0A3D8JSE7_9BURK|nr:acyltransferase [Trinickia dinghuensis]RDU96043.1 acyltransferase [Trinickia dinghuensis]